MKRITDTIKESLKDINEASNPYSTLDALYLYKVWSGDEDYDDWNLSKDDIDELRKHTWMSPSRGGHDGDGSTCIDSLLDGGVDDKWICKVFRADDIDTARDYELDDMALMYDRLDLDMRPDDCKVFKDYVKNWEGDDMKVNPKCGIAYWNSGYDAPMIVLFDVPKTHPLVKALKEVEPFS